MLLDDNIQYYGRDPQVPEDTKKTNKEKKPIKRKAPEEKKQTKKPKEAF